MRYKSQDKMKKTALLLMAILVGFIVEAQQSFTLDEAISYGLENQNSQKINDLEVANAEGDIKEFKSIGMPKVSGGIDYNYYYYIPKQPVQDFISPAVYSILDAEGLPTSTQGPVETFELAFVQPQQLNLGVSASMLVFDGSYIYGLKAAKLYRELVKKQKDASEQEIKANITRAYLSILIAKENEKTLEDNLSTLKKSLDEVNAMFEAGFMESLDVDRLQLSYNNLSIQLENVQGLIQLSYNLLKFQMGFPIEDEIQLGETIEELIIKFDAEEFNTNEIAVDPSNRAEFQLLNKTQELNNLDLKRNKAGYYPSVAAFASFQETLQRTNLFDNDQTGFLPTGLLGFNINIPIYDGGEKSAKIQKVKLNIEKTDIQKNEFTRAMTLQVRNSQIALQNAKRNLENRKAAMEMTESIFNRTKIKFTEGVGSSVEVTQAESSLYQAQAEYISALYEVLQSKVDLDIALGTL
ncbi:MAG: TolC family protein [Saprospiraceae bacterium]|nr:TolC family protein [Saprospiraceae bacterium]